MNAFRDVNPEAVDLWVKHLRYGTLPQTKGSLAMWKVQEPDDQARIVGVCAVGAGMVAMGIDPKTGMMGGGETREFIEWLGGGAYWRANAPVTVCIDWPEEVDPGGYAWTSDAQMISVIALNDELELTFDQIADLIDYFGIVLR